MVGGGETSGNDVTNHQTLGISGFGIIFYQFGVYPWLTDKMGIATLQRACGILSVVLYLVMPNVKHLAWDTSSLMVISVILLALLECANTAVTICWMTI